MSRRGYAVVVIVGLVIAAAVAISSSWFASGSPDGLQRVAEDQGFVEQSQDAPYETMPGYSVPGVENDRLSTALAGVIGVVVVATLALGAGWLLKRRPDGGRDDVEAAPNSPTRGT